MNKLKNTKDLEVEKGMTLIALVVTIVVMLILAGMTIVYTMSGNTGLFKRTKNATDTQEIANQEEQLQIYKQEVLYDGAGYATVDDYLNYICPPNGKPEDKRVNVTNIETIDDQNKYFTVDDTNVYSITELDGDLFLKYQGAPTDVTPNITSVDYAASSNKIAVQPQGTRLISTNTNYKYYIKSDKNGTYKLDAETGENIYVFKNLTAKTTYYVKVEVTTNKGTSSIEVELKTE